MRGDENLPYSVRLMHKEDVDQVTEIDREAFPTQWPSPNYQHELQNRSTHYIVACDEEKTVEKPEVETLPEKDSMGPASRLRRLFSRRFLSNELPLPSSQYVVGFTSVWVITDEAHITNIAVRERYRRRGIGELLLISVIGLATEQKARTVTLEVRVSNTAAQSLYTKYAFTQVGVRKGYYTDRGYHIGNTEDALLMSTQDITSAAFQAHLQQLKQAHSKKIRDSPLSNCPVTIQLSQAIDNSGYYIGSNSPPETPTQDSN